MTVAVLMVDGTWSRQGNRSAAAQALRRALPPGCEFSYVDYPAAFGPATGVTHVSPAESIAAGVRNLTRAVELTPHPAIVAGYSQGAMVCYRFVRDILPHRPDLDVRALAAMGNPHEPTHQGGRGGIAERLTVGVPLLSVWAPGDPIADIAANAPLRELWRMTEWMSVRDMTSALRWLDDVVDRLTAGPRAWWANPDLIASVQAANAYVFGLQHSLDYARHGHAARLAAMIGRYV